MNGQNIGESGIALMLRIIAIITYAAFFILGIINGVVEVGYYYTYSEFSLALASIYWGAGFISGSMMLGFSEIVKLLYEINRRLAIANENQNAEIEETGIGELPPL